MIVIRSHHTHHFYRIKSMNLLVLYECICIHHVASLNLIKVFFNLSTICEGQEVSEGKKQCCNRLPYEKNKGTVPKTNHIKSLIQLHCSSVFFLNVFMGRPFLWQLGRQHPSSTKSVLNHVRGMWCTHTLNNKPGANAAGWWIAFFN